MANIHDVAALAGVSVATVSRYLSAPEKVAKKSQVKVAAAIDQLNYKPNLLARNFSQSRSYSILVLVPDITNPFLGQVVRGIESVGRDLGYTVLLGDVHASEQRELEYMEMLETRLVDGVIQLLDGPPPKGDKSYAIVSVCDCADDSSWPTVAVDDVKASASLVEYLLSLGHERVGCVLGMDIVSATAKRLSGYKQALAGAGIAFDESLVVEGDFSIQSGVNAAGLFLQMKQVPSAVFCMNDEMAIGLIQGLKMGGLRVPEDVSVVGFDDIEFAKYSDPPLTTMRQPAGALGATAMKILYRLLEDKGANPSKPIHHRLPTDLIVRKSTAAYSKL